MHLWWRIFLLNIRPTRFPNSTSLDCFDCLNNLFNCSLNRTEATLLSLWSRTRRSCGRCNLRGDSRSKLLKSMGVYYSLYSTYSMYGDSRSKLLRTKRAWMYTIQCMGVWYILYSHVQLVLPLSFVLTFLLSVTPYTLSRWSTLVRSTITITITKTITKTITIVIQVIDTCKKYNNNNNNNNNWNPGDRHL